MVGPTVRDADLIYFICGGYYAQEVIRLFNDVVTMNRWTDHCGFPVLISWTKKFALLFCPEDWGEAGRFSSFVIVITIISDLYNNDNLFTQVQNTRINAVSI